jgi:Diaminopimelate decarboxylase
VHVRGVGKSGDEIEYALEQGVYSFNVESEAELEAIERIARAKKMRAPIALRVNPDVDPHTHQYISTGSQRTSSASHWIKSGRFMNARPE